ncbi:MAG: carboxypeptidase-like regulatory domain-containing protein [Thermomicrobiales bacterium]|nr:carboxypeptidase-like regulatory domain-containing protein [Thermomicrobiales bacterium]
MLKRLHCVLSLLVAASMLLVPIVTAQDATPIAGDGEASEQIIVDQDAGDTGGDDDAEAGSVDSGEQSGEADAPAANEETDDSGDSDALSGETDDSAVDEDIDGSDGADANNDKEEIEAPLAPAEMRISPMSLDDDPPTITIKLVDAEGNSIPGPHVEIGWMEPAGFTSSNGNNAQADGTITQPVDPSVTHYRIRAYGPWLEQFGELNGDDPQVVVLERTADTQTVTFALAHSNDAPEPFEGGYLYVSGVSPTEGYMEFSVGESGVVAIELPPGTYRYQARTNSYAYEDFHGQFTVADSAVYESVTLNPWPTRQFVVRDAAGNPIANILVYFGAFYDWGFGYSSSGRSDENGEIVTRVRPDAVAWQTETQWVWEGSSGDIDLDGTTLIELSEVSEQGTVTFTRPDFDDDPDYVSISLRNEKGKLIYLSINADSQSNTIKVPAGTYTWTASSTSTYVPQTGTLNIGDGENKTVILTTWEMHPELTITVTNQDGEPASNVYVTVYRTDEDQWAYGSGETDTSGHFTLNVPLGNYEVHVVAPAMYAEKTSFNDVFSVDRSSWDIELEELPNGTLTVNVSLDGPDGYWGDVSVLDSDERTVAYQWTNIDSTGSIELPGIPFGGEYTVRFSDSSYFQGYQTEPFVFNEEAGPIDVQLQRWPEVTVYVQDGAGNPLPNIGVGIGFWYSDAEFSNSNWGWSDDNGIVKVRPPYGYIDYRIAAFDLWEEARGTLDPSGTTTITLRQVAAFGTLTVTVGDDWGTDDWGSLYISRVDGWNKYVSLNGYEPETTFGIPAGDYTWTAIKSSRYVPQTGVLHIEHGQDASLLLDTWQLHPELTIQVINQHGDPAAGVQVNVNQRGDYEGDPGYGYGTTDDTGVAKLNVPYGTYEVYVNAPAKYAEKASFNDVFSVDRTSWDVQLEELPNGTLNVDVIGSPDRAQYVWLQVLDADGRQLAYESQYIYGTQSLAFPDLPYGEGYTITVDGTFWSKPYVSDPFDFDGSTPTQTVNLEYYDTVTVDVVMRSDQPNRALPQSTGLRFSTDNGSTTVYMQTADDGTLRGTLIVPKRQMTVQFDYDRGIYFGGDLPMEVDFSSDSAPSLLEIKVSMADFGLVTVDVSGPEDVTLQGEFVIRQGGEYITSTGIYESGLQRLGTILYPGDYTWEYLPSGPFQAQSGSFRITNEDVTIPLNIKVGANGVVLVDVTFPDIDHLYTYGSVSLARADGTVVASRSIDGSGIYAIGPVLYGTYTLLVDAYDGALQPQSIEVVIDSETIEKMITLQPRPIKTVTFNIIATGSDPVSGYIGVAGVEVGSSTDFQGTGAFTVDVRLNEAGPYTYFVRAFNYQTVNGTWDGQSGEINVTLDAEIPTRWVSVVDDSGIAIEGSYVYVMCYGDSFSAANGLWMVALHGDDWCEISVSAGDAGAYIPQTVELIEGTTQDAPQVVILEQAENVVENITFNVEFADGMPAGDFILSGYDRETDTYFSRLIGATGSLTIPAMVSGSYELSVFSPGGGTSIYVMSEPESGIVEVSASGQSFDIVMSKIPTALVTVNVVDQDNVAVPNGQMWFSTGGKGGASFGPYPIVAGKVEVQLPVGWTLYVSASNGLYHDAYTEVEVKDGTNEVTLVMQRIASIPVPEEPTPSETPVTPTNPVETPTPSETPTTPATVTPTTTVPATETPTETVTPTEVPTQTPTEEPEGEQQLIVHITVPGDADISGSPFELWAPTAATFQVGPLYTGVVGPNNTIVIDGLIPGKYRLVVYPEGMDTIEAMIQVGTAPVTEVLVEVNEEGEVAVTYLETATPTASPTDPAPTSTTEADDVTGLPSTGTGQSGNHLVPVLAMLAAAAVLGMIIPMGAKRSIRRS